MTEVPVANRTQLLSDNGSGYEPGAFKDYLRLVGIKHIQPAPFHSETNSNLGCYHPTVKRDVNQPPHDMPSDLETALAAFVTYYNYRRYHQALGNVTSADMLGGKRDQILLRKKEIQTRALQRRKRYNGTLRMPTNPNALGISGCPAFVVG